jgi:hypothetical protein
VALVTVNTLLLLVVLLEVEKVHQRALVVVALVDFYKVLPLD